MKRQKALYLGNLDAQRDWGHARDYVDAMWRMLQHTHADDFVIATGHMHSVREFVECAFKYVGITIGWQGLGKDAIGFDVQSNKPLIFVDPRYFRPTEVSCLLGDARKAKKILGWKPSVSFDALVKEMIVADKHAMRFEKEEVIQEDALLGIQKKRERRSECTL